MTADPSSPVKILIADDDPQGAELLDAYLSDTEYEVQIANDGEEALRKVQSFRPDLILLDVMMPRISGFEVCKRLRADPATRDVAILMVTALDENRDIDRAVDVGADDFMTKPINKAELLLRIRAALRSRHLTDPLERALAHMGNVDRAEP